MSGALRQRAPRKGRWGLLAVLLAASIAPAEYARRIIADYAAVATIPVAVERDLVFRGSPGEPARDGQGLVAQADGSIFFVDLAGGRIITFPHDERSPGSVFAPPPGEPRLNRPYGLASTADGSIVVLERGSGVVTTYDPTGAVAHRVQPTSPGSQAIATDDEGGVFVADASRGVVRKLTPEGEVVDSWGSGEQPGSVRVGSVIGLAASGADLFATSDTDNTLICIDDTGEIRVRRPLRGEAGMIALGADGHLYMTDKRFNRVWVFDRECREIGRLVGDTGDGPLFMQPRGIAAPGNGLIYVVNGARVTAYRILSEGTRDDG